MIRMNSINSIWSCRNRMFYWRSSWNRCI